MITPLESMLYVCRYRPASRSLPSRFPSRLRHQHAYTHLALIQEKSARPSTGERPRFAAASELATLARLSTRSGAPAHDIRRLSACLPVRLSVCQPARSNLQSGLVYWPRLVCTAACLVRLISSLHPSLPCRAWELHCLLNSRSLLPLPHCLRLGFIKLPPCEPSSTSH